MAKMAAAKTTAKKIWPWRLGDFSTKVDKDTVEGKALRVFISCALPAYTRGFQQGILFIFFLHIGWTASQSFEKSKE
jgi:hypothetical protein